MRLPRCTKRNVARSVFRSIDFSAVCDGRKRYVMPASFSSCSPRSGLATGCTTSAAIGAVAAAGAARGLRTGAAFLAPGFAITRSP